jgi:hypothetical protein
MNRMQQGQGGNQGNQYQGNQGQSNQGQSNQGQSIPSKEDRGQQEFARQSGSTSAAVQERDDQSQFAAKDDFGGDDETDRGSDR